MITDKIKFAPHYAKADSKTFGEAGVEVKGIAPERLWRNLTNISVWPRFDDRIVDIQYEDSADNDPHLFDKAEFNFMLSDGRKVVGSVIDFVHPKDDRVGRLAIKGTVFDGEKQINELVAEFMVGVPENDKTEKLDMGAALSFREEADNATTCNYGDSLEAFLRNLAAWSEKHS